MYRIGLKLWSCNTAGYYQEAVRLYERKIFDYIELYIPPDTLQYLPEWKKLNIPFMIHCAHSSHGFNLADSSKAESNRGIYLQAKKYADELKAEYIIFHGGCDGNIMETARQLASYHEPRALIENKPFRALPTPDGHQFCRGYNITELKTVMNASGCGFCLDFGHAICAANSQQADPYVYCGELAELNPNMYHLTGREDMSSELDSHPHLQKGCLDLDRIFSFVPMDAVLTLETNKESSTSLNDFCMDVQIARIYDFSIRPAEERDLDKVFALSNDGLVRSNSFQTGPIPLEVHKKWFLSKINTPDTLFLVAENSIGDFISQIRYDRINQQDFRISIGISPKYRNRFFGTRILRRTIKIFFQKFPNAGIIAEIKNANIPSKKLFLSQGFQFMMDVPSKEAGIYIMKRELK